jgi:hypothetical protein
MVDLMAFPSLIANLKAAGDLVKGLTNLQATIEINTRVIDLQQTIISAQNAALEAHAEQTTMVQE